MMFLALLLLAWAAFAKAQPAAVGCCIAKAKEDLQGLLRKWETGSSCQPSQPGQPQKPYQSCKEIKATMPEAPDGLYILTNENGEIYQINCNMTTNRGSQWSASMKTTSLGNASQAIAGPANKEAMPTSPTEMETGPTLTPLGQP
ncbi:intelectin-1-like [Pseudonaja textilis]|uniref:intelectin-1-like n=1 Tax=Pseudonaja textilis TaxID=8673 RepID=UPI000EAAB55B|nr:intelectin-1-like [Pseudonaja textilis]